MLLKVPWGTRPAVDMLFLSYSDHRTTHWHIQSTNTDKQGPFLNPAGEWVVHIHLYMKLCVCVCVYTHARTHYMHVCLRGSQTSGSGRVSLKGMSPSISVPLLQEQWDQTIVLLLERQQEHKPAGLLVACDTHQPTPGGQWRSSWVRD